MMQKCSAPLLLTILVTSCAPSAGDRTQPTDRAAEERAIHEMLQAQEIAWNEGNIEDFMQGYWKSDSLRFIGADITTGWDATLQRYRTTYPDRAAMGELRFSFHRFHFVDARSCLVTGRYRLIRQSDEPTGMFTLLVQKIDGLWVIVYDHTS